MFLKCFINFNKYIKSFKKYLNLFGKSHEIHTPSEISNPGQEFLFILDHKGDHEEKGTINCYRSRDVESST